MKSGYNSPLYLLPFDHRQSYVTDLFHFRPPLTPTERDRVTSSKQIIYDGFRDAVDNGVPASCAGILVDEEFGACILHDATEGGYVTALSVEKSGPDEFEFEYGQAFAEHIEAFRPTFAKALVRYNPDNDAALNLRQTAQLRQLADYCRRAGQRLMLELLVPATMAQMELVGMDKDAYDRRTRPGLMRQAIRTLQDAGIEPDIWKIEGLDWREDYEQLVETVRRNARDNVGCIVLGRSADEARVAEWLETAAPVPGMTGFAVGRTTFWDAIVSYETGEMTGQEAVSRIARNYARWVALFERARASRHAAAYGATESTTPKTSS
ncbi:MULTISPECIES: 2-deoxy-5-keto-D-gluconate 6-phosphate aldolase domain-containing protein [Cupriavidus]